MKIYAVIDTNVIVSALLSHYDDAATVRIIRKIGVNAERLVSNTQLPDPKDLVFYEVALSSEDSYLVTGNIKHFPKEPFIVTPAEMLHIIESLENPSILNEPCTPHGKRCKNALEFRKLCVYLRPQF